MAKIERFEDLQVWQAARELCRNVYLLSSRDNFAKDFELRKQIRSASGSAVDCIAEGFGRGGNREFSNFLSYSRGSASEVKSQLYRALDLHYINEEEFANTSQLADRVGQMCSRLIQYLQKSEITGMKFPAKPLKTNNAPNNEQPKTNNQ